jgi:hypothetical protein
MKRKRRKVKRIVASFKQAGPRSPIAELIQPALAIQKNVVA